MTHDFFLSPRAVYLIVFNLVNPQNSKIKYWMKKVSLIPNVFKVLMIGTHLDQFQQLEEKKCSQVEEYIQKITNEFSNMKFHFFPVSCKTREGIEKVTEFLDQMKIHFEVVPASYVRLYDKISEEQEKSKEDPSSLFATMDRYQELALKADVLKESILQSARFLNDVGQIVFFKNPVDQSKNYFAFNPPYLVCCTSFLFCFHLIPIEHSFCRLRYLHLLSQWNSLGKME